MSANRVLGFSARSVNSRSAEVILKPYLALFRPHLDYAAQFLLPYNRIDIDLQESAQRRVTKRIDIVRNFTYESI